MRFGTRVTAILMNVLVVAISYKEFGWVGPISAVGAYAIGTYLNIKYPNSVESV